MWILHPSTKKQLIKYQLLSSIQNFILTSELISHEQFMEKLNNSKLFTLIAFHQNLKLCD